MTPQQKLSALHGRLADIGPCLIAFSSGVDSTFLLHVAVDVLGRDGVLAVTAVSASLSREERDEAERLAERIGARWCVVETDELENPGYRANQGNRCYFCKRSLFTAMTFIARQLRMRPLLYGAIVDDLADDRPGHRAAHEFQVLSPLQEAGLSKAEIRALSREAGLPTWDKPQLACLSSRIPQGSPVTVEKLRAVEEAERVVRQAGFRQVRVRHHGATARIEVEPGEVGRLLALLGAGPLTDALQQLGFQEIIGDPHGYRSARAAHVAAV